MRQSRSERLTVTLGDDQRRRIAAIARQRRTSAATVIRWAVDRYLDAHRSQAGDGLDSARDLESGGGE